MSDREIIRWIIWALVVIFYAVIANLVLSARKVKK